MKDGIKNETNESKHANNKKKKKKKQINKHN